MLYAAEPIDRHAVHSPAQRLPASYATNPVASDLARRCRELLAPMTSIGSDDEEDQRRLERDLEAAFAEMDEAVAGMSADEPEPLSEEEEVAALLADLEAEHYQAAPVRPYRWQEPEIIILAREIAARKKAKERTIDISMTALGTPANDDEPLVELDEEPASVPARRVSKKPTKSRRQPVVSSRATASAARRSAKAARAAVGAPSVSNPSSLPTPSSLLPSPSSPSPKSTATTTTKDGSPEITVKSYAWEHLAYPQKIQLFGRAMNRLGDCLAWSLNLSPDLEAAARAHPERFKERMITKIRRALEKIFPNGVPPFTFIIGTTGEAKGDRLHLHGIVLAPARMIPVVKKALASAGGKWTCAKGKEHQSHARVQYDADGWASYMEKHYASGFRVLGFAPIYVPDHIRTSARLLHEAERKRLSEARTAAPLAKAPDTPDRGIEPACGLL